MDLDRIRSAFPALDLGVAHFDGPGGSQTPRPVADAVAAALTAGLANRGSVTEAERRADAIVVDARAAMGDLLGADPRGIVFGRSMTQLTFDLARTLAAGWGPGDEVVVTRLDHDANIRPWVLAAERAGATVRWLDFDPATAELDDLEPLLTDRTRLVAFTAASNLFGTRPDVRRMTAAAHAAGALVHLDAVHLVPHVVVDLADLGVDLLGCSPYKFLGPHLGVLAARPELLETLHPDKLLPSPEQVPERFELGTLPYELLAGVTATVDFIAGLASTHPDRRAAVIESMTAVETHEDALLARLLGGLGELPSVTVHGRPAHRTPTVLFSVAGHTPRAVAGHLAGLGVNAPASHFYALEASHRAGLGDDGAVRAGLAPYSTAEDVDRLLDGVRRLSDKRAGQL
ncbi:cysteine desulfurase-like protein [Nocardioides ferulae]|uniref:cysteine desulfurase-like protein n=1 Tax=Nocardioides ferulae TaxID=2340821 RepID=UPI001F0BEDA5|nr:cysteine desulfurase-like protein [Nocardioides ferulae]